MRATDRYVVIPLPLLDAPGMALKVYAVLRSYADRDSGEAWPSRKAIAQRGDVSVDSVDKAIRWLADAGWIATEPRYTEHGDRTSNRYHVYGSASPQVAAETPPPPPAKTPPPPPAKPLQELEPVEPDPREYPSPAPQAPGAREVAPSFLRLAEVPLTPAQVRKRNDRLMDDYARWRAEQGHAPAAGETNTILRRAVRDAMRSGIPESVVKLGMADWTEHGNGASSLPAFIDGRARGRAPGQRPARESKIAMTRRVGDALQAVADSGTTPMDLFFGDPVKSDPAADIVARALPPTFGAMP